MNEHNSAIDLFNRLPVGLYRKSPDGRFLMANHHLAASLNYPNPESLLQIKGSDLYLDPDDQRRWQELIERNGRVDGLEVRLLDGLGKVAWFEESAQAILDNQGEVMYYEGVLVNIDERKAAEQLLAAETALSNASSLISSKLDLELVLEQIAREMGQAVGATSAYICRYNTTTNISTVLAEYISSEASPAEKVSDLGESYYDKGYAFAKALLAGQHTIAHFDDEDLTKEEIAHFLEFGGKSIVYIPLLVFGELLGFAEIWESRYRRQFTQAEIGVCQAIAQRAAVAIENARLYEELRSRARELDVLHKVALAAAQTVDWNALLWQTTETLADTLYPDDFGFLLYDQESGELKHHRSYYGIGPESRETAIPLEGSIAGQVFLTGRPCLVSEVSQHDSYFEVNPASRSEIAVPLTVRDKVIGVINTESPRPAAFDDNDLNFLTTLAGQVATAIERAQLYKAQQNYVAHLAHEVNVRTAQLQAERDRIQAILDNAGEGIFFTDPSGTILYVNPAMTRVVGFTVEELLQKSPLFWQGESDGMAAFQEMWAAIQAGQGWRGELTGRGSSGRRTDLFLTIAPISTLRGSLAGFVGVLSDISRLKEVERLKTQFVANISHELRTPLTNIETYVTLLIRGKPERRDHYLSVISNETRRLSRLINGILELSRLETEQLSPLVRSIDLRDVVEVVVNNFAFQFARRKVLLRHELPSQLPAVIGDPDQLGRVISNLVNNALQFTTEGGQVVVSAGTGQWQDQPMIWCEVADDGSGIDPEDVYQIFDRFYRGRRALEQNVPGTGLGLSISKEIVERHGGHVTVESRLEEGSRFTIWLPIAGH